MLPELTREELHKDRKVATGGDTRRLEWFGFKVYSQSDEDGILDEIFCRIGTTERRFVEFGAERGDENNSKYLLETGWSGLWIEGVPKYCDRIRKDFKQQIRSGQLKFTQSFVTRENINNLISASGLSGEIDLLSIDIDSNDYHVFEAISVISPRVVCLEYNHSIEGDWVMPYEPDYRWDFERTDYGASYLALARLARSKGYTLVGSGLYSANCFYVRSDLLAGKFALCDDDAFKNQFSYEKMLAFPTRGGRRIRQIPLMEKIANKARSLMGVS